MKTVHYNRSELLSFYDLNTHEQDRALKEQGTEATGETFVRCNNELLQMSNFVRIKGGLWHGVYGQTAFSAYFIRLNRSNDEALIAFKYN